MILHKAIIIHHIGKHIVLSHQKQVPIFIEYISIGILGRISHIITYIRLPLRNILTVYIRVIGPSHLFICQDGLQRTGFLWQLQCFRKREIIIIIEFRSHVLFTLLGGNQDYSKRSTCSVDSCRSGIFQDRNRLDILRINHIDIHRYIIDQHQRTTTVDRSGSSNIV